MYVPTDVLGTISPVVSVFGDGDASDLPSPRPWNQRPSCDNIYISQNHIYTILRIIYNSLGRLASDSAVRSGAVRSVALHSGPATIRYLNTVYRRHPESYAHSRANIFHGYGGAIDT